MTELRKVLKAFDAKRRPLKATPGFEEWYTKQVRVTLNPSLARATIETIEGPGLFYAKTPATLRKAIVKATALHYKTQQFVSVLRAFGGREIPGLQKDSTEWACCGRNISLETSDKDDGQVQATLVFTAVHSPEELAHELARRMVRDTKNKLRRSQHRQELCQMLRQPHCCCCRPICPCCKN